MRRSRSGAAASITCSDEIGVGGLFERGAERRDQRVRQPVDESDGVGDQQLAAVGQPHLADQRIERDEQRVRRLGVRTRQHVEQRRLARVGVADQRDGRHRRLVPPLAQLAAALAHLSMSSLIAWMRVRMRRRSVSSLVSPGPRVPMPPPSRDSAAPAPASRGSRYLQLRQLDLQLAFAGPRAPREDVEDQLRAVDDLAPDLLLDLAQLRRRQLVVEDDDVDVGLCCGGRERLDLAGAEKRRRIRLRPFLEHAQHDLGAGGLRQAGELVERALGVEPAGASGDQADERGALRSPYRAGRGA